MNRTKRQKMIMELIKINDEVSSKELANEFNVSTMTINRDLNDLANERKINLIHGGAVKNETNIVEKPISIKELTKINEKKSIGKYCDKIIPSSSSVFIEAGTTTLAAAKEIYHKQNCTFFTNSLLIMNALSQYSDINLNTVPGQYRELSKGFIGIKTCEYVKHFNFDYCIIGAEGIDIESGVSLLDKDDAFTKISIMKQSRCKILVADSDKFKESYMYKVGEVSDFDYIITDNHINKATLDEMNQKTKIIAVDTIE